MFGVPTEEQWEKIKSTLKSDKYTKDDFFVFETLATGDRVIPNRYQKINKSALEVMANDAKKGVSLMINHNEGQLGVQALPVGKVFDSRMSYSTQEGEENSLYLSQYISRSDSKVDGYSSNDIIRMIETGILQDTSVCFTIPYETALCNICHKPYCGGECGHFRGNKYVVNEETGETRTCIMEINAPTFEDMQHNGNVMLIENSIVFDGAYPNAVIQQSSTGDYIKTPEGGLKVLDKKEELGKNGKITCYATNSDLKLVYQPLEKGGKNMEEMENKNEQLKEEVKNEVEEKVPAEEPAPVNETPEVEVELSKDEDVKEEAKMSITEQELIDTFGNKEISKEKILEFAKEGKLHRDNVIEETLKSGIKSMGNDFNTEAFRKSFESMSTEDILKNKESFDKSVNEKFYNDRVSKDVNKQEKFTPKVDIDISSLKTRNY